MASGAAMATFRLQLTAPSTVRQGESSDRLGLPAAFGARPVAVLRGRVGAAVAPSV
jgi:hypothetical protein